MSDNAPKGALTNPFALSSDDGYTWLKGNLHSHTTNSDGKAAPQERLDGYVGQGYDFLCLSDHHKITFIDTVQAPSDFVLIQGPNCTRTIPSAASGTTSSVSISTRT